MRTFFISDNHFKHENVIKYENRPFNSVEEMDAFMIKAWNSVVKKNDIVWFLGDLTLSGDAFYIRNLISKLNGRKRMIMGNHDRLKPYVYREFGFEFVSEYPVILKNRFILSHAPLDNMVEPFFYIYGHVHSHPDYPTTTKNSRCVCCERQNYLPIEIEEFNKTK